MLKQDIGKLESVHGISPAFLQRAAFIAAISFIFFLAMLIAFSIRQNVGYFLLASAFLIIEVVTMIGWFSQRGTQFRIYEEGFTYKKYLILWNEIESVSAKRKNNYEITLKNGGKIVLTEIIQDVEGIIKSVETKIAKKK